MFGFFKKEEMFEYELSQFGSQLHTNYSNDMRRNGLKVLETDNELIFDLVANLAINASCVWLKSHKPGKQFSKMQASIIYVIAVYLAQASCQHFGIKKTIAKKITVDIAESVFNHPVMSPTKFKFEEIGPELELLRNTLKNRNLNQGILEEMGHIFISKINEMDNDEKSNIALKKTLSAIQSLEGLFPNTENQPKDDFDEATKQNFAPITVGANQSCCVKMSLLSRDVKCLNLWVLDVWAI